MSKHMPESCSDNRAETLSHVRYNLTNLYLATNLVVPAAKHRHPPIHTTSHEQHVVSAYQDHSLTPT